MARFLNADNYILEFLYRTKLNYYRILLNDETITDEERRKAINGLHDTHYRLENNHYTNLDFCVGTQLINSLIGLLVFPEQKVFDKLSRSANPLNWERDFPTLIKYVFSDDKEIYFNSYFVLKKIGKDKDGNAEKIKIPEQPTPQNIIKHLRNAVCHNKLSVYPVQSDGNNQVTDVIFKDNTFNTNYRFSIKIKVEDLQNVIFEISDMLIAILEQEDYRRR